MTTNIKIIQAHDFLKATPEARLDLEKSRQYLVLIASAASDLDEYEILLDTRKAEIEMSATDLWYLANELSRYGKTFARKTAVLCPQERFDEAGFFALAAQNRGFSVKAFTSFEEAIEWLIFKAAEKPENGHQKG